jgi:hypothetical protein
MSFSARFPTIAKQESRELSRRREKSDNKVVMTTRRHGLRQGIVALAQNLMTGGEGYNRRWE